MSYYPAARSAGTFGQLPTVLGPRCATEGEAWAWLADELGLPEADIPRTTTGTPGEVRYVVIDAESYDRERARWRPRQPSWTDDAQYYSR